MQSDLITAIPERNACLLVGGGFVVKDMPVDAPPLAMKLLPHPAHTADGRAVFIKTLLKDALASFELDYGALSAGGP